MPFFLETTKSGGGGKDSNNTSSFHVFKRKVDDCKQIVFFFHRIQTQIRGAPFVVAFIGIEKKEKKEKKEEES